jgi:hypothetical protein
MDATFCPRCGTQRTGSFRFCRSCGLDFDTATGAESRGVVLPSESYRAPISGQPVPSPAPAAAEQNTVALLAGVLWLAAAAVTAFLAFQQWEAGNALTGIGLSDEGLVASAAWNGVSALLTAYFGARCLRSPTKGFLGTSTAWGVLNVAWGVYQVANGATYSLFYLIIVASALAGILSFAARDTAPPSARAK